MNATKTLALTGLVAGLGLLLTPASASASASAAVKVYAKHGAIYLKADGRTTRLTSDDVSSEPALSPSGTQIAYVHNSTVWIMNTDGTAQHQISDRTGTTPTFTTDGSRVEYTATSCTGNPGTFRTRLTGGTTSEVVAPTACLDQDTPQAGYING